MPRAVLIGASAGGIEPLIQLIDGLPTDLSAPVVVVVHVPADADSLLPEILARRGRLPAMHAEDGMRLHDGYIYVARPDHHLLLGSGKTQVVRGPLQNRHRPSIDVTFRSAARAYGPEAVAVVLSGVAGDAVAGALMIAARGGQVLVQDPDDCLFPGMPSRVLAAVEAARAIPAEGMARAVIRALAAPQVGARAAARAPGPLPESESAMDEMLTVPIGPTGRPSYSCPDCGGVLEEVDDPIQLRYRCRVGHSYYAEDLEAAQQAKLEDALWAALRGMEEAAELSSRLARRAEEQSAPRSAARHRGHADAVLEQAEVIREFLLSPRPPADDESTDDATAEAARG